MDNGHNHIFDKWDKEYPYAVRFNKTRSGLETELNYCLDHVSTCKRLFGEDNQGTVWIVGLGWGVGFKDQDDMLLYKLAHGA